jgi:hypothetical protein
MNSGERKNRIAIVSNIREVREVDFTTEGWEVVSTDGSYLHQIILVKDRESKGFRLLCTTCPATTKNPCWAVQKVKQSDSYKKEMERITPTNAIES